MLEAWSAAKLNLSLTVCGQRQDGYHALHSHVAFCNVGDRLAASLHAELNLQLHGPFAETLATDDNNLVMRAARLLREATGTDKGATLLLDKQLPPASGIGGGSGDGAVILRLLNQLWGCGLSLRELSDIGLLLGADVPVCLYGRACIMEGIGERLIPLPPPASLYAVLVNPGDQLITSEIFAALAEAQDYRTPPALPSDASLWQHEHLSRMENQLEAYARQRCPSISAIIDVLQAHPAVICARMSGSGATCIGLCANEAEAQSIAHTMTLAFPSYWVRHGRLH